VRIHARPTAERRAWLEMARRNALQALKSKLIEQSTQGTRLAALREALGAPDTVQRIECFDVSHTMGEATVRPAWCTIAWTCAEASTAGTTSEGLVPGDDYGALGAGPFASLRQDRRRGGGRARPISSTAEGTGRRGEGSARRGRSLRPLAGGIAKGPERKPGLEELWVGERAVTLPPDHPGLHLIQRIRDEAHRFAVAGHRARRSKRRTTSMLEGIAGIGAKRRKQLLTRFVGGLKGVIGASRRGPDAGSRGSVASSRKKSTRNSMPLNVPNFSRGSAS